MIVIGYAVHFDRFERGQWYHRRAVYDELECAEQVFENAKAIAAESKNEILRHPMLSEIQDHVLRHE